MISRSSSEAVSSLGYQKLFCRSNNSWRSALMAFSPSSSAVTILMLPFAAPCEIILMSMSSAPIALQHRPMRPASSLEIRKQVLSDNVSFHEAVKNEPWMTRPAVKFLEIIVDHTYLDSSPTIDKIAFPDPTLTHLGYKDSRSSMAAARLSLAGRASVMLTMEVAVRTIGRA